MNNQNMNYNANSHSGNSWNSNGGVQQWNDQDMIGDLLVQEKQLMNTYTVNIAEGSIHDLRTLMSQNLEQTSHDQFSIWQQMQQRGWYPTQPADAQAINACKQKETDRRNQMM